MECSLALLADGARLPFKKATLANTKGPLPGIRLHGPSFGGSSRCVVMISNLAIHSVWQEVHPLLAPTDEARILFPACSSPPLLVFARRRRRKQTLRRTCLVGPLRKSTESMESNAGGAHHKGRTKTVQEGPGRVQRRDCTRRDVRFWAPRPPLQAGISGRLHRRYCWGSAKRPARTGGATSGHWSYESVLVGETPQMMIDDDDDE